MGRQGLEESEARFGAYVKGLTSVIGHADRAAPLKHYCSGFLAAQGRRSVEPLAAATAPAKVSVQHQKLLHFVANSCWSDERVLAKVQEMVVPNIERHGPIEAWTSIAHAASNAASPVPVLGASGHRRHDRGLCGALPLCLGARRRADRDRPAVLQHPGYGVRRPLVLHPGNKIVASKAMNVACERFRMEIMTWSPWPASRATRLARRASGVTPLWPASSAP